MTRPITMSALIMLAASTLAVAQWTQLPGKSTHPCLAFCATNNALIAATQDSNILRSTDQGVTWMPSNEGLIDSLYAFKLFSEGDNVYLASNKGAYRSTNGGQQWVIIDVGLSTFQSVRVFFRKDSYLLMGGDSGIFRSMDSGQNWQRISIDIPFPPKIQSFGANDRYLYAGTENHGVYRSTDNGEHWLISGSISPGARVSTIWTDGADFMGFSGGGGYYRSTDYGDTWKRFSGNLLSGTGNSTGYCWLQFGDLILLGADRGILSSIDKGNTWAEADEGVELPVAVHSMQVIDSYVYVGTTNRWIWRRPLSEILPPSSVDASISPYALRLSQSTPNPAIAGTEISYTLPSYAPVTLKLYNAMMQEVSTIVDEPQEAGEHTAAVDANALPSGVYYYRLSTGTSTLTRRMVVVK